MTDDNGMDYEPLRFDDNTEPMLQFFRYSHLRSIELQAVSKRFGDVALDIVANVPKNPERDMALRKLLEAKDCAVRAVLYK